MKNAKELAKKFHNIYEELAPEFGYETRKGTREFSEHTSNGQLMIATCERLLDEFSHELDVNAKITETKYKPATPFTISADSEYDIIYNLRERKNRRIHQPIYENDITISINHRHLPLEQKREIARVIEKALNSNFSL